MLMIDPGLPAARWRRANSRPQKNVPLRVDDGPPRVGRHVLSGHREVGGRVVDEDIGAPELGLRRIEGGGDLVGRPDVALDRDDPGPERGERLATGVEVLRLAAGHHDVRAEAGELGGGRLAEAGPAAGDEDGRTREGARRKRDRAGGGRLGQADGCSGHGRRPQLPV